MTRPDRDSDIPAAGAAQPDTAGSRGRYALRVADLPSGRPVAIEISADRAEREQLARRFDLVDLRKLRFVGTLRPLGRRDWELTGRLGATVVQPCIATLAPVTTRIDTDVERRYLADFAEPEEAEAETPEDENAERLGQYIDPAVVMAEELSLALPAYPRADDAGPVILDVTEPGKTALTDADVKPFASLADLRDRLRDKDS